MNLTEKLPKLDKLQHFFVGVSFGVEFFQRKTDTGVFDEEDAF